MEAKVYLVGGAVRDLLMGQQPKDRDYVVVGSTPELMLERGFEQVGADFPVFLCPKTGEEYALARTERKSGRGYNGFEVDASREVTLEDDLARRDLTINSMAIPVTDFGGLGTAVKLDEVIDPFNGREDLKQGVLRHTTGAFAEDPLRVLRVARFAARFNFAIHHSTVELCSSLVNSGELDDLTPERVWKEVNRAVMEPYAHRFFEVLAQVDALDTAFMRRVFKGLDLVYAKRALDIAASLNYKLDVTLGLLTPDDEDQVRGAKQDKDSFWVAQQRAKLERLWTSSTPELVLSMLNGVRAFHDDGKIRVFFELLNALELLRRVPSGSYELFIKAVQAAEVVKPNLELQGKEIGADLQKRRLDAIAAEVFNLIVR